VLSGCDRLTVAESNTMNALDRELNN
jgi:hypothetical protein